MLATAQSGADFQLLNEAAKAAVKAVFEGLDIPAKPISLPPIANAEPGLIPPNTIGVVKSGLVSVLQDKTVVSVLDAGDLVMPDSEMLPDPVMPLLFASESSAVIEVYDREAVLKAIHDDESRSKHWVTAVAHHQSMILRLNALHIREAIGMGGSPEIFPSGAIIIRQGDPADDIFSMTEGLAEVLVNDMPVAKIRPGELFGTMAALTGSHRNATVRAVESCSVIRVPKDRFFELIRSRPAAVQGLLVDMAKSITELNEEVVTLRRRYAAD